MTKDEALDLALEALKSCSGVPHWPALQPAITAIKKVRALDKMAENARELGLDYEPAEWLTGCPECGMDSGCDCDSGTWNPPAAQRQWVGLTDAEVMQTMSGDWTSQFYFARAIEAKLKEKNT